MRASYMLIIYIFSRTWPAGKIELYYLYYNFPIILSGDGGLQNTELCYSIL